MARASSSAESLPVPRVSVPAVSAARPSLPGGSCAAPAPTIRWNSTRGSSWYSTTSTRSPLSKVARVTGGRRSSFGRERRGGKREEEDQRPPRDASGRGGSSFAGRPDGIGSSTTTVRCAGWRLGGGHALDVLGADLLPRRLEPEHGAVVAEHGVEEPELVAFR